MYIILIFIFLIDWAALFHNNILYVDFEIRDLIIKQ